MARRGSLGAVGRGVALNGEVFVLLWFVNGVVVCFF